MGGGMGGGISMTTQSFIGPDGSQIIRYEDV